MDPVSSHRYSATISFDGGDLDCGNGLLLMIRKHIDPLLPGQLLEILSSDSSVEADLPAWCRLTKNELVSWTKTGSQRSYLVCKGGFDEGRSGASRVAITGQKIDALGVERSDPGVSLAAISGQKVSVLQGERLAVHRAELVALSVMGIGSWPRPRWLLRDLHERLEGRLTEDEFQGTADDAVRLAVEAQIRAGVDVITDGEQRRDNYSSFIANSLDNCQLVPLIDLLPLVDDPAKFESEMQALDVPAEKVRHPAVFGRIKANRPLALHELLFLQSITDKPTKIALPGPYLLTRTMWMECIADKAYATREALAQDIVGILRDEVKLLLDAGANLVQFDEPVLSEVVFTGSKSGRSFMCGALSERGAAHEELEFATLLINQVVQDLPVDRLAMHVCRGNWTPDESAALTGGYEALLPVLQKVQVGTLFLEFCTPRAGELNILKQLPDNVRVGIGAVNPKNSEVESADTVMTKIKEAARLIGKERLLLTPDCGFATFADNPVSSAEVAERKLRSLVSAAAVMREH